MEAYAEALEVLCSPQLRAFSEGKFGVPLPTYAAPAEWYGFPPALIPIWSDGSGPSYLGVWKHWFTHRPLSFVKTYVESGHLTVEIARTEQQLFAYVAIQSIILNDGVTSSLQVFADRVGIPNLSELDEGTVETGDNPQGFRNLSTFAASTPLESASLDTYDGMFPTSRSSSFLRASSFEFKEELFPSLPENPEWLSASSNKRTLFESLLAKDELEAAWFTLNSSGWSFRDAAACGRSLAARSTDPLLRGILEAWSEVADRDSGRY